MKISENRVGTVDVIKPAGPLVDDDAEAFISLVNRRLEAPNPRFVLDMEAVAYLDSRGIEGLVEIADALEQRGGRLRMAAVSGTCREVLELTGHAHRAEYFEDAHTAVRSFK